MTFLAVIIALIFFQVMAFPKSLHQDDWFQSLQRWTRGLGFSPTIGLIAYLGIPCFIVGLVLGKLDSFLFGLVWLGGAAAVLLYSFGRENFNALADRYYGYCQNEDHEAAYLFAQSELSVVPEDLTSDRPWQAHQAIQRRLLYLGYQRWFAVVFFFVVLGPLGALVYRLLQLSRSSPEEAQVASILFYADWVPSRLLAAGFSLTGDFIASRDKLLASMSDTDKGAGEVLLSVGRAAIRASEDIECDEPSAEVLRAEAAELRAILTRSAVAWLAAFSLAILLW
ncbi:MAG: regulatory signaling modulator protein AmpE [Halioglobus sp.]